MFRHSSNCLRVLIAIFALLLGASVYLIDRPPQSAWFVTYGNLAATIPHPVRPFWGALGGWLPDFCHIFAFILLTTAVCRCRRQSVLAIAAAWLVLEIAFELGQKYAIKMPEPVYLKNWATALNNYFAYGHYDPMDILAFISGALTAVATCYFLDRTNKEENR